MAYGCLFNAAILFYAMAQSSGRGRTLAFLGAVINVAVAIHMIATNYPLALVLRPYGFD